MSLEQSVMQHYTHGSLEQSLLDAVQRSGKDLAALTHADLAIVDEFHVGGRVATRELGAQIDLPPGARVLDIGSGIGGPARFFAAERGWKIEGVDLTAEYVEVAIALSRRVGLAEAVSFRQASASALPFPDGHFDGAYMLHVGMNIPDKKAVFADIRRVLKPGGVFAIYDVMHRGDGTFSYPVPWSSEPATNQLDTPENYRKFLGAAGFEVVKERDRRDFAVQALQQRAGAPVVMGATAPQKVGNMRRMIDAGIIAPVEIIARAG